MAKLCLKKPSKRVSCRKRYKIEKKVREHNRKKRKEAKKASNKPSKKLIHVPNICPFKETILKDVKEYKEQMKLERQMMWEKFKAEKESQTPKNLEQLANEAEMKQIDLDESKKTNGVSNKKEAKIQHNTFYNEFQKVVVAADVILEVVDSRDPLGTRCPTIEKAVRENGNGKRLVLVLNKADLIPLEILQKWLKYFRRSVPCIPFKSSTQMQNHKLGRKKMMKKQEIQSGGISVGAENLTSLLANYTRNKGIKTSILVGVVGLPNVGKSSLINTLKRSRACKVGAEPGITRTLQEIQLDSNIKLLDCPGLAFADSSDPHAALKNSVVLSDCMEPAEMVITRAKQENLMKIYLVPSFKSSTEFLSSLAKRYGRFKKGGVPDLEAAARILVNDWNRGKIEYHTEPPEDTNNYEISSSIVTEEVAEFNLEEFDKKVFTVHEQPMEVTSELNENSTSGTNGTNGTNAGNLVVGEKKKKKKRNRKGKGKGKSEPIKKSDSLMEQEGNQRLNKIKKVKFKKMKKQRAKDGKKAENLAGIMENISL